MEATTVEGLPRPDTQLHAAWSHHLPPSQSPHPSPVRLQEQHMRAHPNAAMATAAEVLRARPDHPVRALLGVFTQWGQQGQADGEVTV